MYGDPRDAHLADATGRRAVPVPLRIDYDVSEGRHRPRTHPKCHLTLGERRTCRIPVSSPMTPCRFMDFQFAPSIHAEERQIVHVAVPA